MKISPIQQLISLQKFNISRNNLSKDNVTSPLTVKPKSLNLTSFKSINKVEEENFYERGYSDIKLNENGLIPLDAPKYLVVNKLDDFLAISKSPQALNRYYILNADIDLSGVDFEPIGSYRKPFKGFFDGNGHSIKNLTIENGDTDIGLFGATENARILNLNLENVNITGKRDTGSVVGYARNTRIGNTAVNGNVQGNIGVGGFVGISENCHFEDIKFTGTVQSIKEKSDSISLFGEIESVEKNNYFGGIIGLDNGCKIQGVYVNADIKADDVCGGIIGETAGYVRTTIKDACFEGTLSSKLQSGGIIGIGRNAYINSCVCLKNEIIGNSSGCIITDYITNSTYLKDNQFSTWDRNSWHIQPEMLPRLKSSKIDEDSARVFLQDVNNSRDIGKFPYSGRSFKPSPYLKLKLKIEPPKKFKKNEEIVELIKKSTDSDWLFKKFVEYADTGWRNYNCMVDLDNDEIILALVQNKHLPVNRIYHGPFNNCSSCNPLYISSRFDKPYIFAEMLKRDDIDLSIGSGFNSDVYIFNMLQSSPEDAAAYVFYSSKNPKVIENINKKIRPYREYKYQTSKLLNILNKTYPDIPEYDAKSNSIKIPREFFPELTGEPLEYDSNNRFMNNFDDVLRNLDVNGDYTDSNGNNLINVAVEMQDEQAAYLLFLQALERETPCDNKNLKGYTPIKKLLETGKNQRILADLIGMVSNIYECNKYGENAVHIFANNPDENKGLYYIQKAVAEGISLNIPDNFGVTALMNAIENKHFNMFSYLIKHGADINITDNNNQSALHRACICCDGIEDLPFIYTLIKQNANINLVDKSGFKAFDYLDTKLQALVNMSISEVNEFNSSIGEDSPPVKPIEFNAHQKFLADSNITSTKSDEFKINRTLKTTPKTFNFEAFKKVINESSDKNEIQDALISCLKALSYYEEFEIVDPDEGLLHVLASINHPIAKECIIKYCKLYPDKIDEKDASGDTALILSADSYSFVENDFEKLCCINNINALIENGANVNIVNEAKQNVMHFICKTDSLILLSKLLDLNININQKDILDRTPIEYLSKEITNKMRNYFENYARQKGITLGIENILKGLKK